MVVTAVSQPVLQYSTHAAQIEDVSNYYVIPNVLSIDPGPSGSGVNWDFSNFISTNLYTDNYLDPSGTPFAEMLSDCNLAVLHDEPGPVAYTLCDQSSDQLEHIAGGWDDNGQLFFWEFSDPLILRKYPFTFNDQFTDTYAYTMNYNQIGQDMVIHLNGEITSDADAWGSLVCASGTYNNVLRIKTTYIDVVQTYISGELISTNTVTSIFYEWFTENGKFPVFQIMEILGPGGSVSVHYASEYSAVEDYTEHNLMVFPNPAKNIVYVDLHDYKSVISITLFNSKGEVVREYPVAILNGETAKFDLIDLKPGIYYFRIDCWNYSTSATKLIII
jgi:hypothetical protein